MREYNPEDTVLFHSILDEEWKCMYGGKWYDLPANCEKSYRIDVAMHFAKHMADLVLQRGYDIESNRRKDKEKRNRARLFIDPQRWELYKQMLPELVDLIETFKNTGGKELLQRDPASGLPELRK